MLFCRGKHALFPLKRTPFAERFITNCYSTYYKHKKKTATAFRKAVAVCMILSSEMDYP